MLTVRRRIIYIYISIAIFPQARPDFFRVLTTRKKRYSLKTPRNKRV